MKVIDIYDKHLLAIEEAEMKVRIAKHNLKEAERELDETLAFVESELKLKETKLIPVGRFGIEVKETENSDWILVNTAGEIAAGSGGRPVMFNQRGGAELSQILNMFDLYCSRFVKNLDGLKREYEKITPTFAQSANWKGKGNSEEKKGIKSTTSL